MRKLLVPLLFAVALLSGVAAPATAAPRVASAASTTAPAPVAAPSAPPPSAGLLGGAAAPLAPGEAPDRLINPCKLPGVSALCNKALGQLNKYVSVSTLKSWAARGWSYFKAKVTEYAKKFVGWVSTSWFFQQFIEWLFGLFD